jgi:hypothetical protein
MRSAWRRQVACNPSCSKRALTGSVTTRAGRSSVLPGVATSGPPGAGHHHALAGVALAVAAERIRYAVVKES